MLVIVNPEKKRSVETKAAPDAPAKGLSRTAQGPTLPFGSVAKHCFY